MMHSYSHRYLALAIFLSITTAIHRHFMLALLLLSIFLTALGLVYINEIHRQMMIQDGVSKRGAVHIHNQWEQLTKKQSEMNSELTIAEIAHYQLAMQTPKKNHLVAI